VGTVYPIPWQQMASCNPGDQIMNNVIQTTFAGKNPFTKKAVREVDVSTLRITNDKPKKRVARFYKYDSIFKDLDIGKSLSCKPEDCDKVSQALRSYAQRHHKSWKIKGQMYYTKNTSRVFVLEKK
jgi:cobalamin biosynthesis Co2+ chelatase CbiK